MQQARLVTKEMIMNAPGFSDPCVTVGDIVSAAFERHAIGLCCGGNGAPGEAGAAHHLDPAVLARGLELATGTPPGDDQDDATGSLTGLTADGERRHHACVRENPAPNVAHARQTAGVHGDRHPELGSVAAALVIAAAACEADMHGHVHRESGVLRPGAARCASQAG
jgi:regulator of cell morphogenesis and NO signaling